MGKKRDTDSKKALRILNIYERLNRGEDVVKKNLANHFSVDGKTIQRDLKDIRTYLSKETTTTLEYSRKKESYILIRDDREWLTKKEVMAMCKILLESRAFNEDELNILIDKLLLQTVDSDRKLVKELIKNERRYYVPLRHEEYLMDRIWEMSEFIEKKQPIVFNYERQDGKLKKRRVIPEAIMFSEFYFYLIAYFADNSKKYPAVFRLDRIMDIKPTKKRDEDKKFDYVKRFEGGEFRKRVQFMYSGKLKKVTFEFSGRSLEAILDRLPTAKVIEEKEDCVVIQAEGFGDGIEMWLRTQGENVRILKTN